MNKIVVFFKKLVIRLSKLILMFAKSFNLSSKTFFLWLVGIMICFGGIIYLVFKFMSVKVVYKILMGVV